MDLRAESLQCLIERKDSQQHRDDYLEFINLCNIYLNTRDYPAVKFRRPGAMYRARWMAKLLYGLKICLLQTHIEELDPGTVTTRQQTPKPRHFIDFVALIYAPWWMMCSVPVNAP